MEDTAIQDQYPDEFAHCYGCGRLNGSGLRIRSYWDGEGAVCRFTPDARYSGGIPGFLYGGMIASLLDCHGAATAAAAKARAEGTPLQRFVTASLQVDYLAPTPIGRELEIRGSVVEMKGRKVSVRLTLSADGTLCAEGLAVMVQMPQDRR